LNDIHYITVPGLPQSLQLKLVRFFLRIPFLKYLQTPGNIVKGRQLWERCAAFLPLAEGIEHFAAGWFFPSHIIPLQAKIPVIFYMHGGGYCLGSLKTHRSFMTYLSSITQCCILAIDYPLAPENPFPAALNNALETYQWLVNQKSESPVYIAGDSAGGGLALALLLALKEKNIILPAGVICFSPWADLTCQTSSSSTIQKGDLVLRPSVLPAIARVYAGNRNLENPYISPVFGDFSNMPPIFIQVDCQEILRSDAQHIFEKVKNAKGCITLEVWGEMFHAWPYLASFMPESKKALQHVDRFIRNTCNGKRQQKRNDDGDTCH
jgi:monoterpene epsilon-lactone hydrolase